MTAVAAEQMVPHTVLAELVQVDERVIRRECAKGKIPGRKFGRSWRIPASWLVYATSWSPPGDETA